MEVRLGSTKTLEISNRKIGAINFACTVKHDTANTDLANSDFLPENVDVKIVLLRAGKEFASLPTANLKVLHLAGNFYRGTFEKSNPSISASAATVLVEKASGVKETWLYELKFPFHGPFDLIGDDKLKVTVTMRSNALSSNCSTSDSKIEFTAETDIERYEDFVPGWQFDTIDDGASSFEKNYANLKDLRFICLDKTGIDNASAVIDQASVNSKMLTYNDTYPTILTKRAFQFPTKAASDARSQCFDLWDGDIADEVSVTLTLNHSNVNENKCFVLAMLGNVVPTVAATAQVRRAKHQMQKAARLGAPVDTNVANQILQNEAVLKTAYNKR